MNPNPNRYWYGFWNGPTFANGWCFGETVELAKEDAIKDASRFSKMAPGEYTLTLQQDVSPAQYFDLKVTF